MPEIKSISIELNALPGKELVCRTCANYINPDGCAISNDVIHWIRVSEKDKGQIGRHPSAQF
jgi:hypothetical protein